MWICAKINEKLVFYSDFVNVILYLYQSALVLTNVYAILKKCSTAYTKICKKKLFWW